jgi:hypothetical protein
VPDSQIVAAELRLDLPWVPQSPQHVGELAVQRGRRNVLSYDDGIALEVFLLDRRRIRLPKRW